jgi:hypothetical protein
VELAARGHLVAGLDVCGAIPPFLKADLQEVGGGGTDWIELARDRDRWRELLNAVMNLRVP